MKLTSALFEAYPKCPTKCYLRSIGPAGSGNAYADWVREQNDGYRKEGLERLVTAAGDGVAATTPDADNLKTATWRLAVDVPLETETMASRLHAVERVPPQGRGRPAQFVPVRFVFFNKLTKDDRLLAAFDALVLSEVLGREVSMGKIIHGDDHSVLKVKVASLLETVRKQTSKRSAMLAAGSPPDLILNRHCGECEFRDGCRQKAVEKDDLSLLSEMSEKERMKYRSKGIFTVTQVSYAFRPRRRPKRLRDKRERYHHSLKALAIREKKIHTVGTPELKLEGTPVYLDVEGLPDRDFYYLIGVRISSGESIVQHSLWADTAEDEGKIWGEFLGILEEVERPVLIHYGSYEALFLRRMSERHGGPSEGSKAAPALGSRLNLLSFIYAQIYFPVHSNGLKAIAGWLGFQWLDSEPSGANAMSWRYDWERTKAPALKARLTTYNAEDCAALEHICSIITEWLAIRSGGGRHAPQLGVDSEIVRAESVKDDRLQKWREFKSPFTEFEFFAKAAHWRWQRGSLHFPPVRKPAQTGTRLGKGLNKSKICRTIVSRITPICPGCHKKKRRKPLVKSRYRYELFTGRSSLKVHIVKCVFYTYFCRRCNLTMGEDARLKALYEIGWSLSSFLIYQIISLNIPQSKVAESVSRMFGIHISTGRLHELKTYHAEYYRETRRNIIAYIVRGRLAHADETKIHVQHSSGYVWVLTNLHEVAYVFSPSREAEFPKELLSDFRGVLVSDFYAAYDSIPCKHQRCLIHLIRDLNDAVLDHSYDEELRIIVRCFGGLLKPIIETARQRGLKRHFLNKFMPSTAKFFNHLARMPLTMEAALKCRHRLERDRAELFTFLEHDGVPWHNNNAEHAIKAFARLRRIVGGITTEKGLEEYLILLSVCQTCKYMGVDFLDFLSSGEKDIHAFAESRRGRRRRQHPIHPANSLADEGNQN